ncbi:hypothetical protein B566_EDAN001652 [Ephemera danica]|nr:hypothetical protein B566_EDAN001652 [Ephemera danica]
MKAWKEAGKEVYIYSSGSVEAQKLLFEHSTEGNLLTFISGHFDTEVGPKGDTKSYSTIVSKINKKAEEITFFTDIITEAKAAKEAGLKVVILEREGNAPLVADDRAAFTVVATFLTKCDEDDQKCKKAKIEEEPKEATKEVETTEAEEKPEKPATEAEAAPVEETKEKSEVEVTEEKPVEKKVEEGGDKEEKMDETPAAADEVVEKEETKEAEKKEESAEAPHENGVNGTTEKENGHTNGHTNGDTPSGDAPAEVEDKPKEASPVKKVVVSEAKEDKAEEAVTAE